ncbi:hypothetical protein EJ07DRAFT_170305 [Lizonia empirigonia]|nr:hypothetical protein EJ07DRAFT_170305 [Lizonia empirigonia]
MSHALIFGASGISGWALLNEITKYPTPTSFAKITGLSNRPLTVEQAYLAHDSRLNLINGIDLTKPVPEVVQMLKDKVENAHTISHVFFTAYIQTDDPKSLKTVNTALLDTAIRAIEQVSLKLKMVVLQTGGKGYGLEFPDKVSISPPLREDMPRIPEPYADRIFYYTQYDLLTKLSRDKDWTFAEVRPDGIVGFTPTSNAMNLAQGIGLYLAIYREVHGADAIVEFPGTKRAWKCKHSDTSQGILAKMEIYAATHIEACGAGAVFNIADGRTVTWEEVWPKLCENFGLVGGEPKSSPVSMEDFVKSNIDTWKKVAEKHELKGEAVVEQNWPFVRFMLVDFDFDRQFDLTRSREVGFREEIDTADGYIEAWEKMRKASILPPKLNHEAYMYNRLRMNVSSYLYYNLLIDYRRGERYFAETLIDWDLSNNTQGWEPSYTVFNPVIQAEKNDPDGDYIRQWVPELKNVQGKAIFAPYERLSKEEFEKLGYPKPHVNWKKTKQRCIERFKNDMSGVEP